MFPQEFGNRCQLNLIFKSTLTCFLTHSFIVSVSLQQAKDVDREAHEKQVQELRNDLQETKDRLQSENTLLSKYMPVWSLIQSLLCRQVAIKSCHTYRRKVVFS